jgi:hypothetical protein
MKRTHHRPDDSPAEPAPAPVPAALGDGLEGAAGTGPPPCPPGVGLGARRWAAMAVRVAPTRTATVGPNPETVGVSLAGVISRARSPAAILAKLAVVEGVSDAVAEEP